MVVPDFKLLRAAAQDAGNKNMRKNKRPVWNEDDYNFAANTLQCLLEKLTK